MKVRCPMKTLNNKKPEKQATSFFGEIASRLGFLKKPVKKGLIVKTIDPVVVNTNNDDDIRVVGLDSYIVSVMSREDYDGYQIHVKTQEDVNHASTNE